LVSPFKVSVSVSFTSLLIGQIYAHGLYAMVFGCSERNLGFSGYNEDDNQPIAVVTTSANTSDRRISSDINRNQLRIPQTVTADGRSAAQPRHVQSPWQHVDTKAGETRDGKHDADERRDTSPQVNTIAWNQ